MIFEQTSEGWGRNQLSEKVGKRIPSRAKINSKGRKLGKSLLFKDFREGRRGRGQSGGAVWERPVARDSTKAKKSF